MLYTGLTYCGHPLACAAGLAALEAYDGRGPDRALAHAGRVAARAAAAAAGAPSACIGDVRGGHGLFAVVELVADRDTRAPLAPWPQTPPALQGAGRRGDGAGRVVRDARQPDPAGAAAGDRGGRARRRARAARSPARTALPALDHSARPEHRDRHELPPDLRHACSTRPKRCTSASRPRWREVDAGLGERHDLFIDGEDVAAATTTRSAAARSTANWCWATSRSPTPPTSMPP